MLLARRGPGFYRALLALPILVFVYLIWSGRLQAFWQTFATGADVNSPANDMVTAGLWLGAVTPLIVVAWVLGAEHTTARRLNYSLLIGLGEVVRRARSGRLDERTHVGAFARAPKDDVRAATAWGAGIAIFVPLFFATFGGSDLRSPISLGWLGGTGLLMGAMMYHRRRAAAYLRQEPGPWDPLREWRLLNPARYHEPGRVFVRWQLGILAILPFWWLGGAAVVLSMLGTA